MARAWQKGSTTSKVRTVTRPDGTTQTITTYTGVFRDQAGRRHKASFPNKAQCVAWLRKGIAAVDAGSYIAPAADVTFKTFAETWLDGRRSSLKPAGVRTYIGRLGLGGDDEKRRKVPSPVTVWADRKVSSLTTKDMIEYFNRGHAAGLSRKTLGDVKTLLSSLFEDAKTSGHMPANPIASRLLRLPRVTQDNGKVERETPSTATVNALLDHLQDRDPVPYTAILMMAGLGVRPGEAAGVQVQDLDRVNRRVHIRRNIDARADCEVVTTKTSKRRLVDCGLPIFVAVDALLAARFGDPLKAPADAWVLGGPDGRPFDMEDFRKGCSRRWPVLLVEAGVPHFPMYGLRHYFASRLLERGENPVYVSKQLGHSKVTMTLDVYAHCLPTSSRERGTDALVDELLAAPQSTGTLAGTTARGEYPGASGSVEDGVVEVVKKSRNVRERRGASTTA